MVSNRNFDDFLFGRNSDRDIYKNESTIDRAKVSVRGSRQKNRKNVISSLPPVPVVLNPIPYQITPIGTIPIYFKKC
ncbi:MULTISPECIES: hypothetical protein [unclassified Bacillus (in: firmicutes)]|uniref:hypothetical protein n=1 Tax=unclassified Bacillus (in: firmicutes) TaxID=185979 RepID=UPI000BF1B828|nr:MULTISPECIES: hypothetical protein [unclassified Bacillus (in: firmicutes)]PEJ59065.1 hypothetical protein CN692_06185 [Bacillus sp. AFS002410]PEK99050.1 hypothetical protein CN601_24385 [Bacillus sp. AFS017336]